MAVLKVENIYKSFGGVKAIQDFSIEADRGQIHGIIGPNGAGKTTIFNVVSGIYPPDKGQVVLDGKNNHEHGAIQNQPGGHGPYLPEHPPV